MLAAGAVSVQLIINLGTGWGAGRGTQQECSQCLSVVFVPVSPQPTGLR